MHYTDVWTLIRSAELWLDGLLHAERVRLFDCEQQFLE